MIYTYCILYINHFDSHDANQEKPTQAEMYNPGSYKENYIYI